MKNRHLAILAAVAGIAALGGYIVTLPEDEHSPATHAGGKATSHTRELFSGLRQQVTEVRTVKLRSAAASLELVKRDNASGWVIANKAGYPADANAVRKLIAGLAEAKLLAEKTSKPELYSRIGVLDVDVPDSKAVLVSLFGPGDAPMGEVLIGNQQVEESPAASMPATPRRFVRRHGEAESFLASLDGDPRTDLSAWADTNVLQMPSERVKSAIFTVGQSANEPSVVSLQRENNTQSTFEVQGLPSGRAVKDQYVAARAAQSLSYLSFEDVRPASEVSFDGPGASTAVFTMFDGLRITVRTVGLDGVVWHHVSAAFEPPAIPEAIPTIPIETAPAANAEVSLEALTATPPPPAPLSVEEQAKIDAKAEALADDHAQLAAEAAALNARLSPWAFRLQEFKAAQMRTTMDDLLAPASSPEAPTAPLVPPQ